ncbi:ribonuclease HII [Alkalihalobacillus sp. NPDC078783]
MLNESISTIKKRLEEASHSELEGYLDVIKEDKRKGVQLLIEQVRRKQEKIKQALQQHEDIQTYERELQHKGYDAIAGIDEAGRGPIAGPVVAAAVVLPKAHSLVGLTDSKKLSKKQREFFYDEIKKQAIAFSIQEIDVETIDEFNIYQASKQAMKLAVEGLTTEPDYLLVDAMHIPLDIEQTSLIKGDQKSLSIAAASVLAKVTRDQIMSNWDQTYPGYGFSAHSGYGTPTHLEAMKKQGVTPIHRKSFQPVKDLLG